MIKTKIMLIVGYFVLNFLILSITFPIGERIEYMNYSRMHILSEYALMSAIVTMINLFLVPALSFWVSKLPLGVGVTLRVFIAFILLVVFAWYMGPLQAPLGEIPLIRGPFFSEWLFLSFIIQDATLLSLLAGGYYWWTQKHQFHK